jgi:Ohr subfamily peroxiredoxin
MTTDQKANEVAGSTQEVMKVRCAAKTHTSGGRRGGVSRSDDGRLDVKFSAPGVPGTGTNPEQLFAADWSACFISAMGIVANKMKVKLPSDVAIDAEIDLCNSGDVYFLWARHNVSLPVTKAPHKTTAMQNLKPSDEETTKMKDQDYVSTKTTQIRLAKRSPEYWRVTIDHPPLNIFGPEMLPQVNEIITAIETDERVKVVVFDSAVEGFFLIHLDFLANLDDLAHLPPGPTGLHPWPEILVRLSRSPVASIASIRGRATGMGSELALACDMRFASREKAILSQFEVGAGLVPGGGPMARLSRLMGRGRALEVVLSADDIRGDLAERYGYVNRSLPDADLDGFVDALATRIASFDKQTIADTKRLVNVASLPPDIEIESGWNACVASMARPATQQRIKTLLERGFCKPGDAENRLGDFVGQPGQ